jgi:hypothetical protein
MTTDERRALWRALLESSEFAYDPEPESHDKR